jgi:hypothetical protein
LRLQVGIESIRTRFPVKLFSKTAKITRAATKVAQPKGRIVKTLGKSQTFFSLSKATRSEAVASKISKGQCFC